MNIDPKQLKKFCKYLNIFLENPNKSPANIRDEMIKVKNKTKLSDLSDDAVELILSKYKEIMPRNMVLRDWIFKFRKNLSWRELAKNENAIDYMKEDIKKVELYYLHVNPNPKTRELLNEVFNNSEILNTPTNKKTLNDKYYWSSLSRYENAIDIIVKELKKPDNKIDWKSLSENRDPTAIKLIEEELKKPDNKVDWNRLSRNPSAIKLIEKELNKQDSKVSWEWLGANENAIILLRENLRRKIAE